MRKPNAKPARPNHGGQGQLRIIGGEWRSRRFAFPDGPGLRPTPDRVRETLFNWLAPYVEGARVLDPFAGSGALYLEALSRGAAEGLALDLNPDSVAALRGHLDVLRCGKGQLLQTDALRYLDAQPSSAFDLVFLDPPSTRACCNRFAACWRVAAGWHPAPGSIPKARTRPPHWACRATGACTARRKPVRSTTPCGSVRPGTLPQPDRRPRR